MNECVFCDILNGKLASSIVHQDTICTALLDIQPVNPGHTLVSPNRHVVFLADVDEPTAAHLFHVAQRVAAGLRRSQIPCEGVNLLLADGEAAGQEVFHVHLHVIPRFTGDGFGFRFPATYEIKPHRDALDAIVAQVRNVL